MRPLFGGSQKGAYQKGGFGGCSLVPKRRNEGTFGCSPVPKNGTKAHSVTFRNCHFWGNFPGPQLPNTFGCSPFTRNRNEGTPAKAALLRNRPFVSSRSVEALNHYISIQDISKWHLCGEGKWGRQKRRRIPKCEGDWQGRVAKVFPPQKTSSKQGIWSSQFLRDLSQVVRRTPWDTPVPLYTRTSP